ncbi:MAG: hypothetical protein AB1489_17535 [Acidobacteriota bacterium]
MSSPLRRFKHNDLLLVAKRKMERTIKEEKNNPTPNTIAIAREQAAFQRRQYKAQRQALRAILRKARMAINQKISAVA